MAANLRSRSGALFAAGVLVVAACGVSSDDAASSPIAGRSTVDLDASRSRAPTDLEAQADTTTTVLADRCELYCPVAGTTLAVVGIAFDRTLPLRAGPGSDQPVVATLPPLSEVVATGDNRLAWFEVSANGETGWAARESLLYSDGTVDVTAEVVSAVGGIPRAASMMELGRIVADSVASDEEIVSRVVATVAPTEGLTGTVTYDVIGFPDDSISGKRLRITGRQVGDGNLPATAFARAVVYELVQVDATLLCGRGVSDGLCV